MDVVGTIFIKNRKILIDKPRKRPTYQMIGGRVEDGEEISAAAIRECHEELGDAANFYEDKINYLMDFEEIATSDPNIKIHFYVYLYDGELSGELTESEEIEKFLWYDTSMGEEILSNTLKNEVVPYCKNNNLID